MVPGNEYCMSGYCEYSISCSGIRNDPHGHSKRVRALIAICFPLFPPKDPAGYDSSAEYPELDFKTQQDGFQNGYPAAANEAT